MTQPVWSRFAFTAACLLCTASLSFPYLYGKAIDRWLQENGGAYVAQQGMLSEEGQENQLAYILYRNRFLTGTAIETSSDLDQTRQRLQSQTELLERSGALSRHTAERAYGILARPNAQTSGKTENGFSSVTYWVPEGDDGDGGTVQATWQEKTGIVTFYSVSVDNELGDLEESLEAYRTYLGVETLSDWTEISRLENSVYSWSQAGQLYLFSRWENGRMMLGVTSRDFETQEDR